MSPEKKKKKDKIGRGSIDDGSWDICQLRMRIYGELCVLSIYIQKKKKKRCWHWQISCANIIKINAIYAIFNRKKTFDNIAKIKIDEH